jgi:hypothetical protein
LRHFAPQNLRWLAQAIAPTYHGPLKWRVKGS